MQDSFTCLVFRDFSFLRYHAKYLSSLLFLPKPNHRRCHDNFFIHFCLLCVFYFRLLVNFFYDFQWNGFFRFLSLQLFLNRIRLDQIKRSLLFSNQGKILRNNFKTLDTFSLQKIEYILNCKFTEFLAIGPQVYGAIIGLELVLIITSMDGACYLARGCFIIIHF